MIKTTVLLPPMLHQRLLMAAKPTNKPLSDLIRDLLDKALAAQEQARMKRMYEALDKLDGIGPKGITDASTTINETLYGEHGAWQPSAES